MRKSKWSYTIDQFGDVSLCWNEHFIVTIENSPVAQEIIAFIDSIDTDRKGKKNFNLSKNLSISLSVNDTRLVDEARGNLSPREFVSIAIRNQLAHKTRGGANASRDRR